MSSNFRLYPGDCCRDSEFYSISLNNVASFVVAGNEFGVTQTANFVSPGRLQCNSVFTDVSPFLSGELQQADKVSY